MNLRQLNHVSIRVLDMDAASRFYTGVLGLVAHPEKTNWLRVGESDTMERVRHGQGAHADLPE